MSMVSAVATPMKYEGIPSGENTSRIDVDDAFVVLKEYSCGMGHNIGVIFQSPMNLPVFWECEDHEVIAYES